MYQRRCSASGMTLIELMVTLTLSVTIVSELTVIYLVTNKIHNQQRALHSIMEHARQAYALLQNTIPYAGYTGCKWNNSLSTSLGIHQPLSGTEHTLSVYYANPISANLKETMQNEKVLILTPKPHFLPKETLIISDCESTELLTVAFSQEKPQAQSLYAAFPLIKRYAKNAEVMQWNHDTYLVKQSTYTTPDGKPLSALFMNHNDYRYEELISGIEAMDIHYEVQGDAPSITDQTKQAVKGVTIKLIIASTEGEAMKKSVYLHFRTQVSHGR